MRRIEKLFKRSPKPPQKPSAPGNPTHQITDVDAERSRNSEDTNHGGDSRIALQGRSNRDQQTPASNDPAQTPGSGGSNASLQGREHVLKGSAEAQNEQIGYNTCDLYSAESDLDARNQREHEDHESAVRRPGPLETNPERTPGGDQDGGDAHDPVQSGRSRVKERGRVDRALGRVALAVDLAKGPAEAFGPLKAVLGSISGVYAQYQNTVAVKEKIEILRSRIAALEELFKKPPGDEKEAKLREGLLIKLEGIEKHLEPLHEKSALLRFADNVQDNEDVSGLLEDLQEAVNEYMMTHQMAIYEQGCRLIDAAEESVLNNFRRANGAEFRHLGREGCLKGTRGAVLSAIELWARDIDKSPIYWLNGLAGAGKSTIAKTVAERLFADDLLGASFFCSRDFEDRSNLRLIFPTLAIQLARRYTKFRSILVPLIRQDPEIAYEQPYSQMEKLIVRPLKQSKISTVIVIDALDECKDEESTSTILSVLGRLIPEIKSIKFFLTGRPEPRINEGFRLPLLKEATDVFLLHTVEPSQVDSDVRLFFRNGFSKLADRRGLDNWPTEEQLGRLCERAAGLFVYAAATVKFIDNNNKNPRTQLNILLESQKIGAREGKQLDSLYTSILRDAFGDDDQEDDTRTRSVLGAVILAVNPLSPSAIATLLGFDVDDVHPLLSSVNSLLILRDADHPVKPFHKSFPDFVTDKGRCTNQRFHISPPGPHSQLLIGCLDLMCQKLEKNMCKLPDAVANSDVNDLKERAERYIDPALRYACQSWHVHLAGVDIASVNTIAIASTLQRFLEKRLLFWLEVLSVLGAVKNAVEALKITEGRFKDSPMLGLANDCFRFVTGYFEIISASAPHIYHSALVSAPKESMVRRLYESHARPFTRVAHGAPISWGSNTTATARPSEIGGVAWSPCDRFIAITWGEPMRADILDSVTLQRLQTFASSEDITIRGGTPIFSPDSQILTLVKRYGRQISLSSLDLQTGGVVSNIVWEVPEDHNPEFTSITYSESGKMVAFIRFYGSSTKIFIFDIASGAYMHSHSLNGFTLLEDATWAYGESLRFATGPAMGISVWEVGFTSGATPTQVETFPVPSDPSPTASHMYRDMYMPFVEFLPSPYRLAHVVRGEVLIWDVRSSKHLLHVTLTDTSHYPRMSFSSDGRFFACSTSESMIYIWKESSTGYVLHKTIASSAMYSSLLLSKNGESIVAFGGLRIQLWHTTGFTTPTPNDLTRAPQHTENFVLEFSPDGTSAVVTMQKDDTIMVIDLKSGVPWLTVNAGMEVYGLKMVGNTVAILGDRKLITWNLPTEDCVSGTRVNLEDNVRPMNMAYPWAITSVGGITISPDFRYIAFTTKGWPSDRLLYVCNASTGEQLNGDWAIFGYTPWFTSDGRDIWCVLDNGEVMRWRVEDESVDDKSIDGKNVEGKSVDGKNFHSTGRWNEVDRRKSDADIEHPPEECPWASSRGYRITKDWWILGPDGKRLLMLPPPWQSYPVRRVWKGQFLALLHGELAEPVILELEP